MTSEDGTHVEFERVNLEGRNVGSVMRRVGPSAPAVLAEHCSIKMNISNNIQGVNNSIMVGSEVKMSEPGLGLSLGDVMWETPERSGSEADMNAHE